ncbi:MAG: sugar phosphate isomerase/epimerase [Pseudomonadota bacterium]
MGDRIHLGGTARSLEDVECLKQLGLQFAEIPVTDPERFVELKEGLQEAKKGLGFYYLCHGPREGDPNDMEGLERVYLPKLMHILSIMPELDMRLLTVHFWLDPRFVLPDLIAYKIGLLGRLIERAKEMEIMVCLENLSETASHLSRAFRALPLLNVTLDLGHAQLLGRENTSLGFLDRYPERIKHVHIHDNRGGNSVSDDLHLPVGEGMIDFEGIFRRLEQIGYQRTITLELKPKEIQENLGDVKRLLRAIGSI